MSAIQRLVVVGNGMVGQRLLEKLTATPSNFDITVLCEEPRPAYDRVQLTGFFIFGALSLFALVGLTAVKRRWRTTWGAVVQARI